MERLKKILKALILLIFDPRRPLRRYRSGYNDTFYKDFKR
jgi:hypothetical protein